MITSARLRGKDSLPSESGYRTELGEQLQRLSLALKVGGLGVWDFDIRTGEITCDEQWHRIVGLEKGPQIDSVAAFQAVIHPEDRERATEVEKTARQLLSERQNYGITFRIVRPDGDIRWVRSAAVIFDDSEGVPVRAVGFMVDITANWLAERALIETNTLLQEENRTLLRQTLIDPLTGIANRRALDLELERACLHAVRSTESLTVAMIDIDHFKAFNDRYGHQLGDSVLSSVGEAIATATWRPHDVAARYGGEEFAVLLPDCSDPKIAIARIQDNVKALAIAHAASPVSDLVTISCGCVTLREPSDLVPAKVLQACDALLYEAKRLGRNQAVLSTTV